VKLQEYQSKRLLAAYGVPVPPGEVAETAEAARAIAERLGGRVVVKAQVLVGGRGKAGGIALCETPAQAAQEAERLFSTPLMGLVVRQVLVERAADVATELYLGLTVDRRARRMALMASPKGGVDIEETARTEPEAIHTVLLDPLIGLRPYQANGLAAALGLPRPLWARFVSLALALYQGAQANDATLAEINPLAVTAEGDLVALDAKMIVDDSALFRHPEWRSLADPDETPLERQAREAGISYVKLSGQIACMVNGAGLAMATMDVIKLHGGEPADFLDIGGGAREERVLMALRIILSDPDVAAVLINIFGGITRCDEVARGIVRAIAEVEPRVPLIIRLAGTNESEGRRILEEAHLSTAPTLFEGARRAVVAAKGAR